MGMQCRIGDILRRTGIVDPLKVVRTALVDLSGFGNLLTTGEACVVGTPREDKPVGCSGMDGFQ